MNHLSGLRLSGPDARAFAQSQFTGDLAMATDDRWTPMAWCDPKGRCLSVILLKLHQDHVDLVFPRQQAATIKRLSLFAIGRTVEFQPATACGNFDAPATSTAGSVPGTPMRWLWLDSESTVAPASAEIQQRWQLADIAAAIPWLGEHTSGRFLPQFLNLEQHQGLSFRKGCYPGQEVIARLHYRGTVKYGLRAFISHDAVGDWQAGQLLQLDAEDGKLELLETLRHDQRQIGLLVAPAGLDVEQTLTVRDSDRHAASLQLVHPSALC
ncbi:MAG: CAF17-like 4Fe-4S cluster assembly/insertion protein YgfZ [Wenzhouxiangella sp.]